MNFFRLNCVFNYSYIRSNYIIIPIFYIVSSLGAKMGQRITISIFTGLRSPKLLIICCVPTWIAFFIKASA